MGIFFKWLRFFGYSKAKNEDKDSVESVVEAEKDLSFEQIDVKALMGKAPDDIINRFLKCSNLRIVVDETLNPDEEVQIEPNFDENDDIVSEELAKIYIEQGLNQEAIEIYRKLSLLNSEKSVYFAELIATLENK